MVSKLLKSSTNLVLQRQTTILSAAGVLMVMTVGSAALGLIKLHLLSGLAGTVDSRDALDAFKAAFRLPDLFYQVLVTGALNAAFIPVFAELLVKRDRDHAWRVAVGLMNTVLIVLGIAAAVLFLFAPEFVHIFVAPGFGADKLQLTANLTRLMMVSPMLLGLSAFLTGGIYAHHRFVVPAIAPILYNVGAILGIVWLYPHYGVWGLAYGVLIGSLLHVAVQWPLARHLGLHYKFSLEWKDAAMRRVGKLMLPRTVGLSIDQLESLVAGMLVSTLGSGSLFLFSQVFSLVTFPISFLGVSIAQASLPTLSREACDDKEAFRTTLLTTFHQIMYLVVPVTVLLVVLKLPIVRVVLNFPEWETQTLPAAQVLLFFAPGLIAQSAIHLWVRGFYALQDTVSPLSASAAGVVVSVFIAIVTLPTLGMRGVALGMTAGGFVALGLLMVMMWRKLKGFGWHTFFIPQIRILFCGLVMAVAVYEPVKPMERALFDTSHTSDLIMLSVLVGGFGFALYLVLSWILGSDEVVMFFKIAQKLRSWREAFMRMPTYEETNLSEATTTTEP